MIKGYRNDSEEREDLINRGFGYYNNKFYKFDFKTLIKDVKLNKLNPKIMFFKPVVELNNQKEIDKILSLLYNVEGEIVKYEFLRKKLNKKLSQLSG